MKGSVIGMDVQAARGCPFAVMDGASRVDAMHAYLEMMA
jgi:hypothetical protein